VTPPSGDRTALLFTPGARLGWTFQDLRPPIPADPEPPPDPERSYPRARSWRRQADAHGHAELARLTGVPAWGSAEPSTRRVDVFGGTRPGWQSLLTVHGASILSERPLLVADLSGLHAADELGRLARFAGVPVAEYRLPADLGKCGLLARLTPAQLAEAIAGGGVQADRGATGTVASRATYYTCFATQPEARSEQTRLLTALVVDWLTDQITTVNASTPAVVIAAADEITRPHLAHLADACERCGVPLTLLFRHLPNDPVSVIGQGATAFMRLADHTEAEHAANFLGRHHTFVLSQYTATCGADVPAARQGAREYAVEPAALLNLPDNALLLTGCGTLGVDLQAVECHPSIIALPGASTKPLPPVSYRRAASSLAMNEVLRLCRVRRSSR
jgi:hypothetical protein